MEGIDINYVYLLYDMGYIYVFDGDYMELLYKYIDCIKYVYFKDVRKNVLE